MLEKKTASSTNGVMKPQNSQVKTKLVHRLSPYARITSKWTNDIHVRTLKLLEKNNGKNL
jgi:hypothetical protein